MRKDSLSRAAVRQRIAERNVFVCGCGHSGTSLITAMLGSHPDIYAINEETALFAKGHYTAEDIRAAFGELYAPAAREKGAGFLCEKTPIHIHYLHRIRATFPGAMIIVPVRDPRDVALSIKRRTGSLEQGYQRWRYDNGVVQREHNAGAKDLIVFRYEDFIDDIEGVLTSICGRLGIAYDKAMLNYHQDDRTWFGAPPDVPAAAPDPSEHVKLRNWQIKQPIMERRGLWKAQLDRAEVGRIRSACGDLMEYFGYLFRMKD